MRSQDKEDDNRVDVQTSNSAGSCSVKRDTGWLRVDHEGSIDPMASWSIEACFDRFSHQLNDQDCSEYTMSMHFTVICVSLMTNLAKML
jgi:hypothetical protein